MRVNKSVFTKFSLFVIILILCFELYCFYNDKLLMKNGSRSAHTEDNLKLAFKESRSETNYHGSNNKADDTDGAKKIKMVRDIAAKIKWSADEKFERNLMKRCEERNYTKLPLPKATIIICFHESETLSRLLHTVHSIVQHAPLQFVEEVLLIADNSKAESHKEPLENYIRFVFPHGLVRVHRSSNQLGLIQCRQLGATLAKGQAIVTLDSHMEVRIGWLEALLYEIYLDPKTMATPFMDWIQEENDGNWTYEYGCSRYKTVWYWKDLGFTFMEIPDELKRTLDPTKAILSPVSVGVWAIERSYFFAVGGLDIGMKLWGGENIDLAIRVALAGGRHINVPCSHAAHNERTGSRDYRSGHRPELNYKRLIEGLFDAQYKEAIYYYNPHWKKLPLENMTERNAFKVSLPYNFSHYMEEHDVEHLAPNVNTLAWDGVRNVGVAEQTDISCMWIDFSTWLIKFTKCTDFDRHSAGLFLTNNGEIHNSNHIIRSYLVSDSLTISNYVGVVNTSQVDQWFHRKDSTIELFRKEDKENRRCITAVKTSASKDDSTNKYRISLCPCERNNQFQKWVFGKYTDNYEALVGSKRLIPVYRKATTTDMEAYYKAYLHYLNYDLP